MLHCVAVRFSNGPKLHFIQVEAEQSFEVGDSCIVSTRRGLELATIRTELSEHEKAIGYFVRLATEQDLDKIKTLSDKAEDLKWLLKAKARQKKYKIKIVNLEFNLDESLLIVSYTGEDQSPLKALAKELSSHTKAKIEFVNVGPRDHARLLGTLGVCGDGSCSSTWMQSFNAVGIRMARDQQLPLNPEKISGPCGRLMCCLQFEHGMYEELLKDLPRRGSRACHTESGTCGRITKLFPLKSSVEMISDDGTFIEYPAAELEPIKKRKPNPQAKNNRA